MEASVNFYQTTRRNNPEDSQSSHTRRREDLQSHTIKLVCYNKTNPLFKRHASFLTTVTINNQHELDFPERLWTRRSS
jgi:hypothetical protein